MPRVIGSLVQYPARISFAWYFCVIAIGTMLLAMPISRSSESDPINTLDSVFTSTSAVCVTGLAVRSTGNDFSNFGQAVILALIQLGGIGIMTVTTFVTFSLGGRQGLRQRAVITESLGSGSEPDLSWVLKRVLLFTLAFEAAGFILLSVRFLFDHPFGTALWHAFFHSISAFCNAGFSLNDDSLMRYQGDPLVNGTIMILIVCGGIGFPVMMDLSRNRHGPLAERWNQLMLHSKLVLVGTASLIIAGTVSVLILEWHDALAGMSWPLKVQVAAFQSVTCRTAGFNTIEIGTLTNATLFISILLMAVGGSPCSTAGGFKVSTLSVLVLRGWATFRGRQRIFLWRRTIPRPITDRAIATAIVYSMVAAVALTLLLMLEQSETPHAQSKGLFLDAMFEVVSALGTVGLSTGMTTHLSTAGRFIIIILMFMGRLGPITIFAAMSSGEQKEPIEYAEEAPLIG